MQTKAGIRELKAHLSAYLRQVKAGGTVVITDRGEPIGRIVPITQPVDTVLTSLQEAGLIAWSGKKLTSIAPVARTQGDRTVAELLLEDRA
jgi:prevent-host-death family protein